MVARTRLNACYVIRPLPVLFKIIKMIQNHGEHRFFTPFREDSTEPVLFSMTISKTPLSLASPTGTHRSHTVCHSPYQAARSNQHFQHCGLLSSVFWEQMSSIRHLTAHAISQHLVRGRSHLSHVACCEVSWRVRKNCEKRLFISVLPSSGNNSAPAGRNFITFGIWVFFENLSRKFRFH